MAAERPTRLTNLVYLILILTARPTYYLPNLLTYYLPTYLQTQLLRIQGC